MRHVGTQSEPKSVVTQDQLKSAFLEPVVVLATAAGQTTFTIPGGYTPGAVLFVLEGALLAPNAGTYTATNGTTMVLTSGTGVVVGTELVAHRFNTFNVANAATLAQLALKQDAPAAGPTAANQVLTWNGSAFVWGAGGGAAASRVGPDGALTVGQTVVGVSGGLSGKVLLLVVRNGVPITEFTVSGNNVTFSNAIEATNEQIDFYTLTAFSVADALPLNGKANDSDKLNGQQASFYATAASAFGVNQEWSSVSRVLGTIYTNSTNKPITISVLANKTSAVEGGLYGSVTNAAGTFVDVYSGTYRNTTGYVAIQFPVPPGRSYRVQTSGAPLELTFWSELR